MSAFGRSNDCVVTGQRKLFRHMDPRTGQAAQRLVYDLAADPEERDAISDTFGPDGALLQRAAEPGAFTFEKRFEEPSDETLEQLQTLGYMGESE